MNVAPAAAVDSDEDVEPTTSVQVEDTDDEEEVPKTPEPPKKVTPTAPKKKIVRKKSAA